MAELEAVLAKITDEQVFSDAPIETGLIMAMMKSLNAIINEAKIPKYVEFTANGTWASPATASSTVLLYGIGGGGGGGGVGTTGSSSGGGSGFMRLVEYEITPGTSYSITIGQGGAGGVGANNGQPGGATIFGANLVEFAGGSGGLTGAGKLGGFGMNTGIPALSEYRVSVGGGGRTNELLTTGQGPAVSGAANSGTGGGGVKRTYTSGPTNGSAGGSGHLLIIYFDRIE